MKINGLRNHSAFFQEIFNYLNIYLNEPYECTEIDTVIPAFDFNFFL